MTPDDHEMDDYERELVEEAWGFSEQTGCHGLPNDLGEDE